MRRPITKKRRYGRRPPITLANVEPSQMTEPVDRQATEIPLNAKVAPIEVDDPYAPAGQRAKIVALRSIRTDPLGDMHARRQIDEAQFTAGRYWQWMYERSCVGPVCAVDTSKEPVDGGSFPEPLTDGQMLALRRIRSAAATLGQRDARLVEDVLGHGMFIADAARARGFHSESAIAGWRFIFQRSLDVLAVEFNFANKLGRRIGSP
jgi:hypothetical protein